MQKYGIKSATAANGTAQPKGEQSPDCEQPAPDEGAATTTSAMPLIAAVTAVSSMTSRHLTRAILSAAIDPITPLAPNPAKNQASR
jgi:hypothetical protein